MLIDKREKKRRERISDSLKAYFMTEQGIAHKDKLSTIQAKRMAKYFNFIKDNPNLKTQDNERL